MPLIEIHALPQPDEVDLASISRTLNAAVAEALGCRLEAVWTVWRAIDGPYARGDAVSAPDRTPAFGPIVHVYHHRTRNEIERVAETVETVLARELGLVSGDVFITSQPVAIDDSTLPERGR